MANPLADLGVRGLLTYRNPALKATAAKVKAGPARVYGWHITNLDAAVAYLHLYDAAAAGDVTVGTTTPKITIGLTSSVVAPFTLSAPAEFTLGVVVAATTTVTGTTAPSNGELLNLFYI